MDPDPGRCSVCGIPLRPSQSGAGTCGAPSCRRIHVRRAPRSARRCPFCRREETLPAEESCADPRCREMNERRIEDRREADEREAAIQRRLREIGDSVTDQVHAVRLPANERTTSPLSEERRETFAVNLRAALDRALDDPDRPVPVAPESPPAQAPMIRSACTACRGSCCASGGDRAYLYPDHFRLYVRAHPDRTRDEIATDYLSRLPSMTYQDSCVYHTETGCALPREMRANICNTFLCGDLSDLLGAQPAEAPVPVLAVCFRNQSAHPVRTALLDGRGRLTPL